MQRFRSRLARTSLAAPAVLTLASLLVPNVSVAAHAVPASQTQARVPKQTDAQQAPASARETWKAVKKIPNRATYKDARIIVEVAAAKMRASIDIPPTRKGGTLGAARISASNATRTVYDGRWAHQSKIPKDGIHITTPMTFPAISTWHVNVRADYIHGTGKARRVEHVNLTYTHLAPKSTVESLVGIFSTLIQDYPKESGHTTFEFEKGGMVQYRMSAPEIVLDGSKYKYTPREQFTYVIDLVKKCILSYTKNDVLVAGKKIAVTPWIDADADVNIETTVSYRLTDTRRAHLFPLFSFSTIRNHGGPNPMIGHEGLGSCDPTW